MSKELDAKITGVLNQFYGSEKYSLRTAIAEIKAAVLVEIRAVDFKNEKPSAGFVGGYTQAIKDITENIK